MRGAIQKIDGVESVTVSLNRGLAEIRFKPDNRVTVERVRGVIRDSGFTPKESQARLSGIVTERGGKTALEVEGTGIVYLLVDHPTAQGKVAALRRTAMGKTATVEGRIPETAERERAEEPRELQLRVFRLGSE